MLARRVVLLGSCLIAVTIVALAISRLMGAPATGEPGRALPGTSRPRQDAPSTEVPLETSARAREPLELEHRPADLVVTVVHADSGTPVGNASVWAMAGDGSWAEVARTDGLGVARIEQRAGIVRLHGCVAEPFHARPDATEVAIHLRSGVRIEGVVRGSAAGEDITVVARFPGGSHRSFWEDLIEGHPGLARCPVDQEGRFVLVGLEAGRDHHVEAVGNEQVSGTVTVPPIAPGESAWVELEMRALWGAVLSFRDSTPGDPVHGSWMLDLSRSRPASPLELATPPGFQRSEGVFGVVREHLAGGLRLGYADGVYRSLVLLEPRTGPVHPDTVATTFELQLPGYEWISGTVEIARFRNRMTQAEFELNRVVDAWGSLVLEFQGLDYLPGAELEEYWPEYQLDLQADDGDPRLAYGISAPLRTTLLEGIPVGSYQVELRALGKPLRIRIPEPVRVDVQERSSVTFDLATYGAIELVVVYPDGRPFQGHVAATVIAETAPGSGLGKPSYYSLPRPPYLIRNLPAKPYWIWLEKPRQVRFEDAGAPIPDTVVVGESEIAEARFVLDP